MPYLYDIIEIYFVFIIVIYITMAVTKKQNVAVKSTYEPRKINLNHREKRGM